MMEGMVCLSEVEYLELKGKLDELIEFKNSILALFEQVNEAVSDNPMLNMMFGGSNPFGNSNH